MPEEEFTDIDVLLERIMLLNKIEAGEKNITEGKIYTTDEVEETERALSYQQKNSAKNQ